MAMDEPYNGASGRTSLEATTVWCGGCGIWFGSNVYRTIDAETDSSLLATFLADGFTGLNTCICPSCSWRHIAQEPLAIHFPQRRQFFLYVPTSLRHRAQMIRTEFLASVAAAPGVHVPRYVFEPILVGSRTELKQLVGDTRGVSKLADDDYSSIGSESVDTPAPRSVAKRSQTLNLLAELVGEDAEGGLLDAATGSAVANRQTEPLHMGGMDLHATDHSLEDEQSDPLVAETEKSDGSNAEAAIESQQGVDSNQIPAGAESSEQIIAESSEAQSMIDENDDAMVTQRELASNQLLPNRDATAEVAQLAEIESSIEESEVDGAAVLVPAEELDDSVPSYESEALLSDIRSAIGDSTEDSYNEGLNEINGYHDVSVDPPETGAFDSVSYDGVEAQEVDAPVRPE